MFNIIILYPIMSFFKYTYYAYLSTLNLFVVQESELNYPHSPQVYGVQGCLSHCLQDPVTLVSAMLASSEVPGKRSAGLTY